MRELAAERLADQTTALGNANSSNGDDGHKQWGFLSQLRNFPQTAPSRLQAIAMTLI